MNIRHPFCAIAACAALSANAQINLVATSNEPLVPLRTLESGVKLITRMTAGSTGRNILNLDMSPFRTLAFPPPPAGQQWSTCSYVTEALFDTDPSTIEFILMATNVSGPGDIHFRICREDGTVLFEQTIGAAVAGLGNGLPNAWDPVFMSDGVAYLLLHATGGLGTPVRLYELPGTLPCLDCYGSPAPSGVGMGSGAVTGQGGAVMLFPNPATDQVTVAFGGLQPDAISFCDASGRQLRVFAITAGSRAELSTAGLAPGYYQVIMHASGRPVASLPLVLDR